MVVQQGQALWSGGQLGIDMSYSTVIKENIMKRYSRLICLITVGAMANPTICNAEIITDGTVGPATAITGPNYDIAASLGTLSISLYHISI